MRKAVGLGKSASSTWGKTKDTLVSRNPSHERTICDAISKRLSIELRYKRDTLSRSYEPHVVYHAETDNVLVTGFQLKNPNKPYEKPDIHNFIIGNISTIDITNLKIAADARIDRSDDRFKNGIICSI